MDKEGEADRDVRKKKGRERGWVMDFRYKS